MEEILFFSLVQMSCSEPSLDLAVASGECQRCVMDRASTSCTTSLPASVNRCGISAAVLLRDCVRAGHTLFCKVSKAVLKETSS